MHYRSLAAVASLLALSFVLEASARAGQRACPANDASGRGCVEACELRAGPEARASDLFAAKLRTVARPGYHLGVNPGAPSVTAVPGFRVASITAEDLADITRMRLMLDVQALAESIQHGDDKWEAAIVAAYHRLEKVESRLSEGPVRLDDDWGALHRDFHMALIAACPSERQRNWSASLFDQAERYRRYSARYRKTPRRKSNEHKKIMDAVLKREMQTACALLQEHILGTQRSVELVLKNKSAATAPA